jgi:hypothetical protein
MELLVQRLMDSLRRLDAMVAGDDGYDALLAALDEASVAHERMVQAMTGDLETVPAAGHAFALLAGNRLLHLCEVVRTKRDGEPQVRG